MVQSGRWKYGFMAVSSCFLAFEILILGDLWLFFFFLESLNYGMDDHKPSSFLVTSSRGRYNWPRPTIHHLPLLHRVQDSKFPNHWWCLLNSPPIISPSNSYPPLKSVNTMQRAIPCPYSRPAIWSWWKNELISLDMMGFHPWGPWSNTVPWIWFEYPEVQSHHSRRS